MKGPLIAKRLRIHGRVQGVWYRESMRREAERLGVRGWVRNRMDGSVEAAVEGETGAIDLLVRWAHRGPEDARVQRVDVTDDPGGYKTFEKRDTL